MLKHVSKLAALALLAAAGTVSAGPIGTGFSVNVYYNLPNTGPNSVAETLADITAHGPADNSVVASVVNYVGSNGDGDIGGGVAPPGYVGGNVDHYAITADGWVTGLSGPTSVTLGVNSDDGFAVYDNNVMVGNWDTPRGPADTTFSFTASNGDHLQLVFFEKDGGDEVELWEQLQGGPFLVNGGSSTFGVNSTAPVPEPSSFVLAGLGALGLVGLVRRRRKAA